ncbi:MAG: cohesin domain-containing protein [bacterium]
MLLLPEYQLLPQGGSGFFDVFVYNIYQFFGLEAYISFNPNILQVSTITRVFDGWATNLFDNAGGTISIAGGINIGESPISGSLTIARVHFNAIGTGTEILDYGTISPMPP